MPMSLQVGSSCGRPSLEPASSCGCPPLESANSCGCPPLESASSRGAKPPASFSRTSQSSERRWSGAHGQASAVDFLSDLLLIRRRQRIVPMATNPTEPANAPTAMPAMTPVDILSMFTGDSSFGEGMLVTPGSVCLSVG